MAENKGGNNIEANGVSEKSGLLDKDEDSREKSEPEVNAPSGLATTSTTTTTGSITTTAAVPLSSATAAEGPGQSPGLSPGAGPGPSPGPSPGPGPGPSPASGTSPGGGPEKTVAVPVAPQAAAPAEVNLNLLDECAVCRESLQGKEPKLLPCLHSFCKRCLPEPERQLSIPIPAAGNNAAGNNGDSPTIQQVGVIRCPVCRQECRQIDLVDNYFVKDSSEGTNNSDEKSCQVCTSCEDNAEASGFCVECLEWLCKTCVEAHQRVKFTKDHTIRRKEDVSPEAVGAPSQRPVFCPIHKQEQLKLFCETCDKLTCRDCQLLEHKEHRYQFLEEAFQNQKVIIETLMAKLQEKKNYVQYAASQVQNRLNEVTDTNKKVEHDIKVAIFTLINEINKKGKNLLQQLENVTKERQIKLLQQQQDVTSLARQVEHVMNFAKWAISSGSSTALLYSKRLITFQLRHILRARCDPVPAANGGMRFHCDPTFWAKNVVNLGNLVIENKPNPPGYTPNVVIGHGSQSQGPAGGKPQGQINLAQLRLQHMQQQFAQKQQQMQQMRMSHPVGQHPRTTGPQMVQQQPPRLISMQAMPRGNLNGAALQAHQAHQAHQMRLAQNAARMAGMSRHNGHQYPMMPQMPRQHTNPGHTGPFSAASVHNSIPNPTSPTTASLAGANRGPTSPTVAAIELIPSVTNPENLPPLPDIPPIQLDDAGSSTLDNLLSRFISDSHHHPPSLPPPASSGSNPSPGPSAPSPGPAIAALAMANSHTPVRPSSTSSTGSRGSCSSSGKAQGTERGISVFRPDQVRVKQEPGTEDEVCSFTGASVKHEHLEDGRRSACMMSSPESSLTPPLSNNLHSESETDIEGLRQVENHVKLETFDKTGSCRQLNNTVNGKSPIRNFAHRSPRAGGDNSNNKDEDPNEDWCAVCQNGGDLLCCDKCPKVFHLACHVPTLLNFPSGEWICTFCRDLSKPEVEYDCDNLHHIKKGKTGPSLAPVDQRKCERLLLYLYCHEMSIAFQEPVPSSVPDYYRIIKNPMDLSRVKMKLQKKHSQHYQTPENFVADIRLIFKNCEKFNEVTLLPGVQNGPQALMRTKEREMRTKTDSEVAQAGKALESYFETKLQMVYSDRTFTPLVESDSDHEDEAHISEDSDDDFVQPRRKRLKSDDRPVHIK
ncbi:E3 ubiquitin-protein ligase TRIM33 isoform X1 [Chiloscyllium plagiosum]|uniref:E3 ubiquitin-protein ligase TRIM33 isoform X1 n=1 Tax=Chiloscyllium plagiosum TaxID=36176 RepID=UPI001CB8872D|nr:E3 ubiquitin-protein ligase TRIM33 isoform X1 [Chiloscyllium plagiosum]